MCVRPAPASSVITISLVGGAWTLDTNIPSPFTLTFYRVTTWKPFYLSPFTLKFYRVTTWKQFICHLLHSNSTGWQPGNHLHLHCHLLHSLTVTFYTQTGWPPGYEYVTFYTFIIQAVSAPFLELCSGHVRRKIRQEQKWGRTSQHNCAPQCTVAVSKMSGIL